MEKLKRIDWTALKGDCSYCSTKNKYPVENIQEGVLQSTAEGELIYYVICPDCREQNRIPVEDLPISVMRAVHDARLALQV